MESTESRSERTRGEGAFWTLWGSEHFTGECTRTDRAASFELMQALRWLVGQEAVKKVTIYKKIIYEVSVQDYYDIWQCCTYKRKSIITEN